MNAPPPAPPGIDTSIAHPARVYDFFLGGKDNYEADRAVAHNLMQVLPEAPDTARRNREFIGRAIRLMVGELGIAQVVDIGTGIPTSPAVHQLACAVNPEARVAYVDNDPIVLAHNRALLSREPGVRTVLGDVTDPDSVIAGPELDGLIDWSKPVALIIAAVFHFVPDSGAPLEIMARYRDRMAPGSAVALSMATNHGHSEEVVRRVHGVYAKTAAPLVTRTMDEVGAFFDGFRVVEPGLTYLADWRPDEPSPDTAGSHLLLAGVGVLDR